MSKTTFRILPDQTYVITVNGDKIEMLGKDILTIVEKDLKSSKDWQSWSIFDKYPQ